MRNPSVEQDQNSGALSVHLENGTPHLPLFLSGTIAKGYELSWDDRWVKLRNSRF